MAAKSEIERSESLRQQLRLTMDRPQRHRLLHGYPLAAAMRYVDKSNQPLLDHLLEFNSPGPIGTSFLVGILPHPFCNPKITGCGFCTFPHEFYSAAKSEAVASAVVQEIETFARRNPRFVKSRPNAVYFGGGTANLTPPKAFQALCESLRKIFDVTDAEVSLEGVPSRFLQGQRRLIEVMQDELPARHFRISMGIQTFSAQRLKLMGREGFGNAQTFRDVVHYAHCRGLTTSADLLLNQPDQKVGEMFDDVRQAIDLGLDQICLYHLVLFSGLGTSWARQPSIVASLPCNAQAAENWISLRLYLIQKGYVQTSLTNFERQEVHHSDRRYQYESISFEDSCCQVVGFGPSGISFTQLGNSTRAIKTMNPESSAEYMQAVQAGGVVCNRYFHYQPSDLQILDLTRKMAALKMDREAFELRFGRGSWQPYQELFDLFCVEELLSQCGNTFELTSKGMFYSDAMASLLAKQRWQHSPHAQRMSRLNDNRAGHM